MSVVMMSEQQMEYEANWPMPKISVGDPIVHFVQWNDQTKRSLAFVTRVSHRSIECLTVGPDGRLMMPIDVLHKDDPRLVHNVNLQRSGAWDYSDLEKRVRALEETVESDVRPVAPAVQTSVTESVVVPQVERRGRKPMSEEAKAASRARLQAYHQRKREERQAALQANADRNQGE